jgi:hypothetical protein
MAFLNVALRLLDRIVDDCAHREINDAALPFQNRTKRDSLSRNWVGKQGCRELTWTSEHGPRLVFTSPLPRPQTQQITGGALPTTWSITIDIALSTPITCGTHVAALLECVTAAEYREPRYTGPCFPSRARGVQASAERADRERCVGAQVPVSAGPTAQVRRVAGSTLLPPRLVRG